MFSCFPCIKNTFPSTGCVICWNVNTVFCGLISCCTDDLSLQGPQGAVSLNSAGSVRIMGFLSALDYSSCPIRGPFVLCSHGERDLCTLHSGFCLGLLMSGKIHISTSRETWKGKLVLLGARSLSHWGTRSDLFAINSTLRDNSCLVILAEALPKAGGCRPWVV